MSSEGARPGPDRYVALDSLRGICACMVVLLHFGSQSHIAGSALVQHSFLFVDFFFVLSGFVIGSSYGQRLIDGFSVRRFMWLRFWRIYPLHFVVLMALLGFELLFWLLAPNAAGRAPFAGNYTLEALLDSLLLVQIFIGPDAAWNLPAWSIAAEIWTYLTFAILLRVAGRWIVLACLAIAATALIVLPQTSDLYIVVFHSGAYLRCLYGFAMGIIGWCLMPHVAKLSLGSRAAETILEGIMIVLVAAYVTAAGKDPLSMIAPMVFLLAVLVFARQRGAVSALLRTGPFARLGMLSYSIYMIHWFLLFRFVNGLSLFERLTGFDAVLNRGAANMVGGGPWFSDAMTILFLAIVIGVASLTYRFIEKPGQAFGRRQPGGPGGALLPVASSKA